MNFHVRFLDVSGALLNELHVWYSKSLKGGCACYLRKVIAKLSDASA